MHAHLFMHEHAQLGVLGASSFVVFYRMVPFLFLTWITLIITRYNMSKETEQYIKLRSGQEHSAAVRQIAQRSSALATHSKPHCQTVIVHQAQQNCQNKTPTQWGCQLIYISFHFHINFLFVDSPEKMVCISGEFPLYAVGFSIKKKRKEKRKINKKGSKNIDMGKMYREKKMYHTQKKK